MPSPIGLEIQAAKDLFRWHEVNLRELLRGPQSPVARDLVRRAIAVEGAAKINASADPPSVPGGGPAVRTGRLRGSITWRLGEDIFGLYADVGSSVLYAPYVELGTSNMEARPFLRPALEAARL